MSNPPDRKADHAELLAIADKAAPAYERWKQHGRIHGDDTLLYEYGKVATPHAVATALRSLQAELEAAKRSEKELRRVIDRGRDSNATELALAAQLSEQREGNIVLLERAEAAESRLATVRAEVIEECAKVCEELRVRPDDHSRSDDDDTRAELNERSDECAAAIRALNETAAEQETDQLQRGDSGLTGSEPAAAAALSDEALRLEGLELAAMIVFTTRIACGQSDDDKGDEGWLQEAEDAIRAEIARRAGK